MAPDTTAGVLIGASLSGIADYPFSLFTLYCKLQFVHLARGAA